MRKYLTIIQNMRERVIQKSDSDESFKKFMRKYLIIIQNMRERESFRKRTLTIHSKI